MPNWNLMQELTEKTVAALGWGMDSEYDIHIPVGHPDSFLCEDERQRKYNAEYERQRNA